MADGEEPSASATELDGSADRELQAQMMQQLAQLRQSQAHLMKQEHYVESSRGRRTEDAVARSLLQITEMRAALQGQEQLLIAQSAILGVALDLSCLETPQLNLKPLPPSKLGRAFASVRRAFASDRVRPSPRSTRRASIERLQQVTP